MHGSTLEQERDGNHDIHGWEQLEGGLKKSLSIAVIQKHIIKLTLASRRVMTKTKCAVKITRKYFVASLRIVPSRPGIPNRRVVHRAARWSIIKNASKSSKNVLA